MPSLHPDYEYDIFISYRQNDNRSDKWVTNFVNALKEELIATLKNPVSIYFDENPHDGLLETHLVDASLAKKLKCLVFIPIISQTYCDETSFAWEHEFLPFVQMAKADELGMNITLSNGNVTSRVLPIKIHDLDTEDQLTLEAVLDGPLRSIDFIYKEPGVNSPLKPSDDRKLNLDKTDYQYQINKVANSLKDIGASIIKQSAGEISLPTIKTERIPDKNSLKKALYASLAIIIIALLSYWGYKQFLSSPPAELKNITIAVLAFDDQSPDGDQEWLGDGLADEILNVLAKVEGLQVIGKTSSFSFKGKGLTTRAIGETLNVSTVLEGSVSKIGDKLRITAQLIDVDTDAHIWSKKYDRGADDIFAIIDEVSQSIASALKSELSIEDLEDIKVLNRADPEAYEFYLKGVNLHWYNFLTTGRKYYFEQSEQMFLDAISIDSTYTDAYAGLADLYYSVDSIGKRDSIINIGYKLDPNSANILAVKGISLDGVEYIDSTMTYLQRAYTLDPNNNSILTNIMYYLHFIGLYDNAIALESHILLEDPFNMYVWRQKISSLIKNGEVEKARRECGDLLKIAGNDIGGLAWKFHLALLYDNDIIEAKKILKEVQRINHGAEYNVWQAWILAAEGKKTEALNLYPAPSVTLNFLLDMPNEAIQRVDSMTAVTSFTGEWTYLDLKNMRFTEFIRDEPRFKEILAEAKKVHEERVAKYGHLFDE